MYGLESGRPESHTRAKVIPSPINDYQHYVEGLSSHDAAKTWLKPLEPPTKRHSLSTAFPEGVN